jgi:hypothetical protein
MKHLLFVFPLLFWQIGSAQKIGSIDLYGNRKINSGLIYSHLELKPGDSINRQTFKAEDIAGRLMSIPGVKKAVVNPVCCGRNGNLSLFIGIGEDDSAAFKYRDAPGQDLKLPDAMTSAYQSLEEKIEAGIKNGQAGEDDSHGYALAEYPAAREEQNKFIPFASANMPLLINVLKESKYAKQRAAAAEILAYSDNRNKAVSYLMFAVYDPEEEVRNNATRGLVTLIAYLQLHPELRIYIPAGPFIEMLNSIVWSDRNKGAAVLMQLSRNRNPRLFYQIKEKAYPSLIEMAEWNDRQHALSSFSILGRMAGVDEKEILDKNFSTDYLREAQIMIRMIY